MHQVRIYVTAGLLFFAHTAFADMFNVQLSNNTGRFLYSKEVYGNQYGPVDMELGLLFNQDSDKMVHFGMMVRNDTLDNPLVISIGLRAYYGDVGHKAPGPHSKFGALAIGGELLFIPDNLGGLGFGVHYYLAPSVVSYVDADKFTEYGFRVNYELTKQANVSLGYQKIEVDLKSGGTLDVDSSVLFGIGLRF